MILPRERSPGDSEVRPSVCKTDILHVLIILKTVLFAYLFKLESKKEKQTICSAHV